MGAGVNNWSKSTETNKGRYGMWLKNYICVALDSDQEFKRYLKYPTRNPLSSIAVDLNNNRIVQPDVDTVMNENWNLGNNVQDSMLIPYPYLDKNYDKEQIMVFVSGNINTRLNSDLKGSCIASIDILVPTKYDVIAPYGNQRIYAIFDRICQVLDDRYIDPNLSLYKGDKFVDLLGDTNKTHIVDNFIIERINETDEVTVGTVHVALEKVVNGRFKGSGR